MPVTDPSALMTLAEAADRLQVDPKTVRRYIASGRLTGYRVGPTLIRLDPAEVDNLRKPIRTQTLPAPRGGAPETNAETIARLGLKPGVLTPLPPRTRQESADNLRWCAEYIASLPER